MQVKTKDRIIEKAIELFNRLGFMNVSMQRLADELSVSPGNLTYHFPKKESLMLAIYERFQIEMKAVIPSSNQNLASLTSIDRQISDFFDLQQRFLFFYLDLLEIERSFHEVAERHYAHIENQIEAISVSLRHNSELGYLRKREKDRDYKTLAQQLWFTAVFWPVQCRVRGKKEKLEDLRHALWSQIRPYMTDEGHHQIKEIVNRNSVHLNTTSYE